MGLTELLHFRRFLRKGRRVADGSRHFVFGLDKTSTDAVGTSSTGVLPKGNHFIVSYNPGIQLNAEEMDACNNNSNSANGLERSLPRMSCDNNDRSHIAGGTFRSTASNRESVVYTMMPGASMSGDSARHNPAENDLSNSPAAVLTTTELQEIRFFMST